jgi:hypothetical protein
VGAGLSGWTMLNGLRTTRGISTPRVPPEDARLRRRSESRPHGGYAADRSIGRAWVGEEADHGEVAACASWLGRSEEPLKEATGRVALSRERQVVRISQLLP